MPRRSRQRSGARKPVIIAVILIVLLSAWFWQQQRARHAEVGEAPEVAAPADGQGTARTQAELPLPPIESTRPGADAVATPAPGAAPPAAATASALPAFLPPEAHATLRLIAAGGPFPHRQDGNVFGNREGRLPSRQRGYYREYTVDTPGLGHRGTRRIVTGGNPPSEYYYSDDHYESFRPFQVPAGQVRP